MIFWGALLALVWDQFAPLFRPSQWERLYGRYADWVHDHFNAGTHAHGGLAWAVAALAPALLVGLFGHGLKEQAWLLGLAWSAAVLYRCTGFRQVVDLARALSAALAGGDPERARGHLADLGVDPGADATPEALIGMAIDRVFRLALDRLFGVLFWFVVFGAFGALAYALTRLLAERWRGDSDFHAAIGRIVPVLDWAPARLLAFSFAIVGNFETAMTAWRGRAGEDDDDGVVRTAGLGALGIDGDTPGPEYVAGAASLLNRAVLLWLGVLGLFWLGGL